MTFTAIVTCHEKTPGLRRMLGNLLYQTRRPDETLVFVSGVSRGEFCRLAEDFPWAQFFFEDDRQDWGHAKRAAGVERARSEYLGFFNDDDEYSRDYIARMLEPGTDVVYCAWDKQPDCNFSLGSSTSGNFIVRTEVARRAGYPPEAIYENDGFFINRLNSFADHIHKIEDVLYYHNAF